MAKSLLRSYTKMPYIHCLPVVFFIFCGFKWYKNRQFFHFRSPVKYCGKPFHILWVTRSYLYGIRREKITNEARHLQEYVAMNLHGYTCVSHICRKWYHSKKKNKKKEIPRKM